MKQTFDALVNLLMEGGFFLEEAVELLEKSLIARALERTGGNRSAASKALGIHRNTLQKKMRDFQMEAAPARRKPSRAARGSRGARAASA